MLPLASRLNTRNPGFTQLVVSSDATAGSLQFCCDDYSLTGPGQPLQKLVLSPERTPVRDTDKRGQVYDIYLFRELLGYRPTIARFAGGCSPLPTN